MYRTVLPCCRVLFGSKGFTLIEIAVVIAIIGMVMAIVLPRLPSSEGEDVKISARTLAATLRYAQERAATNRTTYFFECVPGSDSLRITEGAGDGGEKEPGDPLLQKRVLRERITVADVMVPRLGKVSDGQLKLAVGVGGLRELAVIHLRSPAGQSWTVAAFPAGGKVKLYEGYQEEPQ